MAKSKKRKPSFDAPESASADKGAEWVYRSDAAATPPVTPPAAPADPDKPLTFTIGEVAPIVPAAASAVAPLSAREREKDARLIVDRYTAYAAAVGLVPIPLVDMAAIAGIQVKMLSALSALYGVPFSQERGRVIVAALLGAVMPTLAGHQIFTTIARRLTVVGALFGAVSVSGFAVAATYAVGRVFTAHFESGGTLLDIDLGKAKEQVASGFTSAPA